MFINPYCSFELVFIFYELRNYKYYMKLFELLARFWEENLLSIHYIHCCFGGCTVFTALCEYAEAALAVLKPNVSCTVIRFVCFRAKFGTCTVVRVNWTLVESKMCTFTLESTHFIFNMCPL
jgi:hypothetical protein